MLNFNKLIPKLSFIFFFFLQNQLFGQKLLVSEILNDTVAVVNDNKLISNIRIGDIKQKYIIIDLWATWCKPCIDNHKNLENIYSRHSDSLAVITLCGDTYNNFSSLIKFKLTNSLGEKFTLSGTLAANGEGRLVEINGFDLDETDYAIIEDEENKISVQDCLKLLDIKI